ncbi:MAG: baseplate J/gp47 family protein [Bacteroidia bacterium]|jgi:hypothetical protein|nr:baseplate J/gp47 family protein [Bacteroidia bacterium]
MSTDCKNKNTLLRNGTSQPQRKLRELLPDYIGVDERSIDDLMAFARQFATEIRFHDVSLPITQPANTNWVDFFTHSLSNDQRTAPHYALFAAFLELFSVAQNDLNGFTEQHLDFYYRDVLQLKEKPAAADQVFLVFKLAAETSQLLIAKAAEADAKKDALGNDLVYTTDNDIVLNQAEVAELKSVFIDRYNTTGLPNARPNQLYASPVANSADGQGAEFDTDEKRWKIFGRPSTGTIFTPADYRPFGELGFAFASPVLWMAEGRRSITITLCLNQNFLTDPSQPSQLLGSPLTLPVLAPAPVSVSRPELELVEFRSPGPVSYTIEEADSETTISSNPVIPDQYDSMADVESTAEALINALDVKFSGEKEWLQGLVTDARYETAENKLIIKVFLSEGIKAVTGYQEEVLQQPFRTAEPVVKITFRQNSPGYPLFFSYLNGKTLYRAHIRTHVNGVRKLILQSDDATITPDKPFAPFGNRPQIGSTFYVGSPEIMSKHIDQLNLSLVWHGRPDNFAEYYNHYKADNTQYRNNNSFKVQADLLIDRKWKNIAQNMNLFAGTLTTRRFNFDNTLPSLSFDTDTRSVEEYTSQTRRGFLRLTLKEADFGHNDFQTIYAERALYLVTLPTNPPPSPPVTDKSMPREPHTPMIKSILMDYVASDLIDFTSPPNASPNAPQAAVFYHVEPFGVAPQQRIGNVTGVDAMPYYGHEGNLFVGLRNLKSPQVLTLLFKVAEGSADPDVMLAQLTFSYLSRNRWVNFTPAQILGNTTNNLLDSGIVTLSLPRAMNTDNTLFTDGLGWIRISAAQDSASICDLIDVKAQAVTATFDNRDNDPAHLEKALPAQTIKALLNDDDGLRTVEQPFASFGGHAAETPEAFRIRVSERLRHKQRAITIWDYEHLVLESFPQVFRAKAINHTRMEPATPQTPAVYTELAPGHVAMVLVADLRNKNAVNPLQPRLPLLTLEKVKTFLRAIMPPLAEVHVRNPYFEEIRLTFDVKFRAGFDISYYSDQLQKDIRSYLAPWLSGNAELNFGGSIHKSAVIDMIDELPYVDYVSCFTMDQIVPGSPPLILSDIETAEPTRAASVLTSSPLHIITVLEDETCDCPENDIRSPFPEPGTQMAHCGDEDDQTQIGIGSDIINNNFIVGQGSPEGIDYWTIDHNFNVQ